MKAALRGIITLLLTDDFLSQQRKKLIPTLGKKRVGVDADEDSVINHFCCLDCCILHNRKTHPAVKSFINIYWVFFLFDIGLFLVLFLKRAFFMYTLNDNFFYSVVARLSAL